MDKFSELKAAAMAATPGPWFRSSVQFNGITTEETFITQGNKPHVVSASEKRDAIFIAAANPAAVLALLAELEAKDKHIADMERVVAAAKCDDELWDAMAHRLKTLEDKLATPVRLPDELARIGENLHTQDNRITSEPMFCVYQKREIVADAEYDHDRIVWVDEDGLEANERQRMRLELLHNNCREAPAKWRRVAVKEIDEFVTCCFTEQGCKDYLACNGHNLRLPFVYVKSGFRNAEYIALRKWLMTFTVEGDE